MALIFMRKIAFIFILIFFNSCQNNKEEKKFLGTWYAQEAYGEIIEVTFLEDTLYITDDSGNYAAEWKLLNNNRILFYNMHGPTTLKEIKFNYEIDSNNLELDRIDNSLISEYKKADDAFNYFQKKIELNIDLPNTTDSLMVATVTLERFLIYAGYRDNNLIVKTDYSNNLSNLKYEVDSIRNIYKDHGKGLMSINLIADKDIPNKSIDSILEIINSTSVEYIFRTYKNTNHTYKHDLNWFGKLLKN
ncbi:hypothetical protein [Autumnicola psychrophila]|uniref:Lipocalin-like domain-containing protein n=1 Tax=Autumnicola psychrophila TaxID=3075592 RepID=A0ABU3DWN6_9FLAO|nr:hypothetical protein [Zunongwangia sp. F225]MDT0688134.1 hypothetical protein [Zunongwangia sp. F225]